MVSLLLSTGQVDVNAQVSSLVPFLPCLTSDPSPACHTVPPCSYLYSLLHLYFS